MQSLDPLFARLSRSKFRSRFRLGMKERQYCLEKGAPVIEQHAACLLYTSWKSLKRTIKKGPNGPFNYCVCSSSVTGQRRNIMIDQINAAKAGTAPT